MKTRNRKVELPVGRAAMLAFQLEILREDCCRAATSFSGRKAFDEEALEECARLDDALAAAHRVLKHTLAGITLARLRRPRNSSEKRKGLC